MPEVKLPTYVVKLHHESFDCYRLSEWLRKHDPPIIARTKSEAVHFDFRTVTDDELQQVINAFLHLDESLEH